MEPQLGADLSAVKVGTDGKSATAAEQLGARAFTVDGEVHFGSGEFAPGTKEGDRLLAHELTIAVYVDDDELGVAAAGSSEECTNDE